MRLSLWSGHHSGSPDSWVPCTAAGSSHGWDQVVAFYPLLLSLWPWAYAPWGKGRSPVLPPPLLFPQAPSEGGAVVQALLVGCWVPISAGSNVHPTSPNTFYFQLQHLGRPWRQPGAEPPLRPHPMSHLAGAAGSLGWCQLLFTNHPVPQFPSREGNPSGGPNCAACPSCGLPC